jgi:hypothetical protein
MLGTQLKLESQATKLLVGDVQIAIRVKQNHQIEKIMALILAQYAWGKLLSEFNKTHR